MRGAVVIRVVSKFGGVLAAAIVLSFMTNAGTAVAFKLDRTVRMPEPLAITAAPDGSVWVLARRHFTSTDKRLRVFRIDQRGRKALIELPQPKSKAANFGALAAGADGNVWLAISGVRSARTTTIHRLTPAGRRVSSWVLPRGTTARSLAAGPDGRMWFLAHDSGHVGRLDRTGKVSRVALSDARSYIQLAQGIGGAMWAVRRGSAARIDGQRRVKSFTIPDQSDGAIGLARGADGRMWFGAPGEFHWLSAAGDSSGTVPLQYVPGDGGGGDASASMKRFPVSMSARADGLMGFVAASQVEARDIYKTGPFSIGAIEPNLTAIESAPGTYPVLLSYAEDYELDPMDQRGRYGLDRMSSTPDGKQWVLNRDDASGGAVRFTLDRQIPLLSAKLQIESAVRSGRSVVVRLACDGQPGKFCAGTLSVRKAGRTTIGPRRYAMKPGDSLKIRLTSRGRLPGGKLSVIGTAKDPIASEVVSTVKSVDSN